MRVLAIDPGLDESAFLLADVLVNERSAFRAPLEAVEVVVRLYSHLSNEDGLLFVERAFRQSEGLPNTPHAVVIETIPALYSGGGRDQLETERWGGAFREFSRRFARECNAQPFAVYQVPRASAKSAVLGTSRGTDADVRSALIEHFGGKAKALGVKCKCGGKARLAGCRKCGNSGWLERPRLPGFKGSHPFACLACIYAAFGSR